MKRLSIALVSMILLTASFLGGAWYQGLKIAGTVASSRAQPDTAEADEDLPDEREMPLGSVRISSERQQMIGVRTDVVEKAAGNYLIRAVGRIAPDEKRVYRLVAGADGWIRETFVNDTGTFVKKDERLATFYNPQFRAAQLSYFSTLSAPGDQNHPQQVGRPGIAPSAQANVTLQTYIDALESLGMSEKQMKELAATKQLIDRVYINSPAAGYIIARNVSAGQRFEKGFEWYQIANLDKVWVLADLFPNDAGDAKPGAMARVTLPGQKMQIHAPVAKVLPQLDPVSRTLKLRLELDNPGHLLRPDMLVDVEIPVERPAAIVVPADAVLASGLRTTVFVERGSGYFEPREVQTGRRFRGVVEITAGLAEGERIVTSGNFLIDSESKLSLAAQGMKAAPAAAGAPPQPAPASQPAGHQGHAHK